MRYRFLGHLKKKRYRAIERSLTRKEGNIKLLCAIAGVSRKGYYGFLASPVKAEDGEITTLIIAEQRLRFHNRGYRSMTAYLRVVLKERINAKRVLRLMQETGMLSNVRRKQFTPEQYLRRKQLKESVPANLLCRKFVSLCPGKKYVTDITYLHGIEEVRYLCMIEDLFNGEIVAYAIESHPDGTLCCDCVKKFASSCDVSGAILHSDQGSSYTSLEYRLLLEEMNIRQSCSYVGQCWENACMESCNGVIKTESLYNRFGKTKVKDRRIPIAEIVTAVEDFIPFYNNERPKRQLGGLSPVEFRRQNSHGTYPAVIRSLDSRDE
jgi:transposase InsO family protein